MHKKPKYTFIELIIGIGCAVVIIAVVLLVVLGIVAFGQKPYTMTEYQFDFPEVNIWADFWRGFLNLIGKHND